MNSTASARSASRARRAAAKLHAPQSLGELRWMREQDRQVEQQRRQSEAETACYIRNPLTYLDGDRLDIIPAPSRPVFDDEEYGVSTLPSVTTPSEQEEIDEALALADLSLRCFSCDRPATLIASGQSWCSAACAHSVISLKAIDATHKEI